VATFQRYATRWRTNPLEQEVAAARLRWREEDELRRKWRNDTLEEHRHRDTPSDAQRIST
jgi:hypothetical protein